MTCPCRKVQRAAYLKEGGYLPYRRCGYTMKVVRKWRKARASRQTDPRPQPIRASFDCARSKPKFCSKECNVQAHGVQHPPTNAPSVAIEWLATPHAPSRPVENQLYFEQSLGIHHKLRLLWRRHSRYRSSKSQEPTAACHRLQAVAV